MRISVGRVMTKKILLVVSFICIIYIIIFSFKIANEKLLPTVLAMTSVEVRNNINHIIFDSTNNIITENNLASSDFYRKTRNTDGKINSISVNTVLVNEICSKVAKDISKRLAEAESQKVHIPSGVLLGVDAFANMGPKFEISVLPVGTANVDYETKFESVGINQISFQVWLTIDVYTRVINPLQSDIIDVNRKFALVNTVFSGDVPNMHFDIAPFEISDGYK